MNSVLLNSSEEKNYTCNHTYLNNVAERSDITNFITTISTPETEHIDSEHASSKTSSVTSNQVEASNQNKDAPINAPGESLLIVSFSVTESTLS